MADSLSKRKVVDIPYPNGIVAEYQACGLNSIITLLNFIGHGNNIKVEEIKEIFDFDKEGISNEAHRFSKFNTLLNERKIPYRFYYRRYSSLQDLYRYLGTQGPVPVFFWMKILHFTKNQYKNLEYQIDFGEVFQTGNRHILLFVGYDQEKDEIYFLDPSYQLPFITSTEKNLTKYHFKLNKKDFYECTTMLKAVIEVKYSKVEAKKYKREKNNKDKQSKLVG